MSETPEQEQAFEKVDELVDEAGWREERKWLPWLRWWRWSWFPFWSMGPRDDPPAGSPGLREALHEDDEKS